MGEALKDMAERLDMQDLRFLAVAVTIQQQSGGNLAEILAGLSKVIRARFRLFRRVKAITAEAKWSGKFLSGFPIVALIVINLSDPHYYDDVKLHHLVHPRLHRRRHVPGRQPVRDARAHQHQGLRRNTHVDTRSPQPDSDRHVWPKRS